jgi:hypothetical protein
MFNESLRAHLLGLSSGTPAIDLARELADYDGDPPPQRRPVVEPPQPTIRMPTIRMPIVDYGP